MEISIIGVSSKHASEQMMGQPSNLGGHLWIIPDRQQHPSVIGRKVESKQELARYEACQDNGCRAELRKHSN